MSRPERGVEVISSILYPLSGLVFTGEGTSLFTPLLNFSNLVIPRLFTADPSDNPYETTPSDDVRNCPSGTRPMSHPKTPGTSPSKFCETRGLVCAVKRPYPFNLLFSCRKRLSFNHNSPMFLVRPASYFGDRSHPTSQNLLGQLS